VTKYRTILADPPWNERGGGKIKRGADRHYDLMRTHDIIDLMRYTLDGKIADDAHLYLWVTNNYLPDGLAVLGALGFSYKTNIVWAKNRPGIGQYFRGQHELCLFGVRGKGFSVRTERRDIATLLGKGMLPRTEHSVKPPEIYELVESRSEGPYIELFARRRVVGWDSWGNDPALDDDQ
jgi:N6-adenosine-specific RNA methylase IME4